MGAETTPTEILDSAEQVALLAGSVALFLAGVLLISVGVRFLRSNDPFIFEVTENDRARAENQNRHARFVNGT